MNPRPAICALALCWIGTAYAGHGFMNSFADIEWLPDPGRTPDQLGYVFDTWDERARLVLASTRTERYTMSLQFAREKLAEVEAMVRQRKTAAAKTASAAYRYYIDAAAAALAEGDESLAGNLGERFAKSLLEHRYIMSVNYLDLPRGSRTVIGDIMAAASAHYERLTPQLDAAFKESLFFKEEEVRWSTELAQRADAQGL